MSDRRRGVCAAPVRRGRLPIAPCLLPVALFLAFLAPARGQSPMMTAAPGLDGYIKPGCWLPIEISLENPGNTVEGDLVASVGRPPGQVETRRHLRLAAGARQRHVLLVCIDRMTQSVPVRFRGAKAEVPVRGIDPGDRVVLAVSDDRTALGFVQGVSAGPARSGPYGGSTYQPQAHVAHADAAGLYDTALAYSGVDVIALGTTTSRALSPGQKRALREWTADGGTLLVSGGSDVARLRDPFWQDLLPVQDLQAQAVPSLAALGARYGFPIPPGPAMIARGRLVPGARARVEQEGVPLIASRPYGNGTILFFAFDFDQAPVRGWGGQVALWRQILAGRKDGRVLDAILSPSTGGGYRQPTLAGNLADAVTDVPTMDLPSARVIGFFFLMYLLCLVPVNYVVLRRLDRREYAWATTPAIAALFCLVAYFVGHQARGNAVVPYRLDVVESGVRATWASGHAYVGLFSPRRRAYALRAPGTVGLREAPVRHPYYGGPAWAEPTRPYVLAQDEDTRVEDVLLNTNAMRVFTLPVRDDLGGTVVGNLHLSATGIEGEIVNGTRHRFTGGILCFGRITQNVKALDPGERVTLDPLAGQSAGPASTYGIQGPGGALVGWQARRARPGGGLPDAAERIQAAALSALLTEMANAGAPPHPVLLARGDPAGTPVEIEGRHAGETRVSLYILHLDPPGAAGGGMTLPANIVPGRVSAYGPGANLYPDGRIGMNAGSFIIKEFSLPGGGVKIEGLTLQLDGQAAGPSCKVVLTARDPSGGAWTPLPVGAKVKVPRPQRLVDPARRSMQVRLAVTSGRYYLKDLGATVRVR